MKQQNFKNHGRLVAGYHGLTFFSILALLIGSFVNLFHAEKGALYSASLLCLCAFIFLLLFWFIRTFALKAQDRAIRAEESLRYFILTGKAIDSRLSIGQIIALRFASDDEFVALSNRAATENLSSKGIKEAIQNWKADFYRV
jgi:hypothetical protein